MPQRSSVAVVFKRKGGNAADDADNQASDQASDSAVSAADAAAGQPAAKAASAAPAKDKEPASDGAFDRAEGPYDAVEAPEDGMARVDFGSLQIPGVEGMSFNLEVDEQSQNVVAITVVLAEGGVQLQAFAAPRSGDFWPEVRQELAAGITASGGIVDVGEGPFGQELRASVPATDEQGNQGMQNVRFVGVEGPRWLLRGVMLGEAAAGGRAAEVYEDVFRGCIVARGNQPMAPGDMLPLSLPEGAVQDGEEAEEQRPSLDPFERGPEITEIG